MGRDDNLKVNLKKYYGERKLSDAQYESLQALIYQNSPRQTAVNHRRFFAVCATVAIVAVAFFAYRASIPVSHAEIAAEVSYNHNKRIAMEVVTASFEEVQKTLDKLDIFVRRPDHLPAGNFALVGGRYCSIQGYLAAQMRLHNGDNNADYTLYQSPIPANYTPPEAPIVIEDAGNRVHLWVERGVLMVLAGP